MDYDDELRKCVYAKLENCFDNIDHNTRSDLHKLLLQEIEKMLLEFVISKSGNNKSKSAKILGINRATLQKKIKAYNLLV